MSDSDQNPSDPTPEKKLPKGSRSNDSKRPERQPSSNLFWYLMIGLVIIAVSFSFMGNHRGGEKLAFSEFKKDLESGDRNKTNVFEVEIAEHLITFQDQPAAKSGDSDSAETTKRFYVPAVGLGDIDKASLTELLTAKDIKFTFDEPPPAWESVLYLLSVPILFIIVLILLFRRMGGPGAAMSFGRSRGRLYAQEDIEVTFDSAAGIEEAVDWATELLLHMRKHNYRRIEPTVAAENEWQEHVKETYKYSLIPTAKSWFTGYNSNVAGHDKLRYMIYNGGSPRYRKILTEVAENKYRGFNFS